MTNDQRMSNDECISTERPSFVLRHSSFVRAVPFTEAYLESTLDFGRNKLVELVPKGGDLADQRTADVRILFLGHQENGLDLGVESQVGQRHAKLVLHIAQRAQAAQNDTGADLADEAHGQSREWPHFHVAVRRI